ncbi:MAG: ribosomal protein S18-alanine N-acetyltransferase [Lactobacillus sp.]|nr:ribosomal protein S18-alanine N-acetyltransferase [Lactobacillus sp.]MCI2032804.1 ribosomal protein S18-alanine N-acetyltransferase [Lactobacillus sp.]
MLRKFKAWFDSTPPPALTFAPQTVSLAQKEYQLRKMTNADIDAALSIERAVYNDTPWDRVAFLSELRKREHSLYLVLTQVEDDLVVAFVGCWFSKAEAHITNIAVAPGLQHQGIGRFLMRVMIAKARDFGSDELTLEVRVDNVIAQALYHQLGFVDGRIKKGYYVANHEDALDMARDLRD